MSPVEESEPFPDGVQCSGAPASSQKSSKPSMFHSWLMLSAKRSTLTRQFFQFTFGECHGRVKVCFFNQITFYTVPELLELMLARATLGARSCTRESKSVSSTGATSALLNSQLFMLGEITLLKIVWRFDELFCFSVSEYLLFIFSEMARP